MSLWMIKLNYIKTNCLCEFFGIIKYFKLKEFNWIYNGEVVYNSEIIKNMIYCIMLNEEFIAYASEMNKKKNEYIRTMNDKN